MTTLGVVVIGRNEGERLLRCLESVRGSSDQVVYVDSGSTDTSIAVAKASGATVVKLDLRIPFTAARARNGGFDKLLQVQSTLDYVFFVDGDCEIISGWLNQAKTYLDEHSDIAVVSGLLRERFPEKSLFNLLIDIEWREYPFGETKICGGVALMRVSAVSQVKGFRNDMICGEEPELCVRLRQAGWRIWRLEVAMAWHDAAMYRFGQWWTREIRAGYAYAQGVSLHGAPPELHCVTEYRRVWLWGLAIPLIILILVIFVGRWGLLLLSIYPLQIVRLASIRSGFTAESWLRAAALTIGKFPAVIGQIKFHWNRVLGKQNRLIEYK